MRQLKSYILLTIGLLAFTGIASAVDDIGMVGLKNFTLGANITSQKQNIEQTQHICVYSVPKGRYQIEFMSNNNKQFFMRNDKFTVPVKIYWNDIELQPNVPVTFSTGAKTMATTNCQNVKLTYKMQNTNRTTQTGMYRENVGFRLSQLT